MSTMNAFDSSLEATFTFSPLTLAPLLTAVFNNFWAWLAFVAASFTFWRLRSSPPKNIVPSSSLATPPPTLALTHNTKEEEEEEEVSTKEDQDEEKEQQQGLTKGSSKKFLTAYYDEEEDEGIDEMDGEEEEEEKRVVIKRWGSTMKELTVEMRGGEMGWYRYQDRKVIDGSVVRLWQASSSSRGNNNSCRGLRRCCSAGLY